MTADQRGYIQENISYKLNNELCHKTLTSCHCYNITCCTICNVLILLGILHLNPAKEIPMNQPLPIPAMTNVVIFMFLYEWSGVDTNNLCYIKQFII